MFESRGECSKDEGVESVCLFVDHQGCLFGRESEKFIHWKVFSLPFQKVQLNAERNSFFSWFLLSHMYVKKQELQHVACSI